MAGTALHHLCSWRISREELLYCVHVCVLADASRNTTHRAWHCEQVLGLAVICANRVHNTAGRAYPMGVHWRATYIAVPIAGSCIATIFFALRLWSRYLVRRKCDVGDVFLGLGLLFCHGISICTILSGSFVDFDLPMANKSSRLQWHRRRHLFFTPGDSQASDTGTALLWSYISIVAC